MNPNILSGISALAARYDGFILDVWGVLHNGVRPYPGVIDALTRLLQTGKSIVLLSNAPMRATTVIARLEHLGIAAGLYHGIQTSGEEVWQNLNERADPFYAGLGNRCLWLGPDRHESMVAGLNLTLVDSPEAAGFILNTGPDDLDDQATRYLPLLEAAAAQNLPMICANADLHVMQGNTVICCAGVLAKRYEERGGVVRWHGKPYPSVYHSCFKLLGLPDLSRVLAVGDNLATDIAGAAGVGVDSALVAGGIHAEELRVDETGRPDPVRLDVLCTGKPQPTWILPQLLW